MAIGTLKLNVDTAGAQRSIDNFSKSWTEANSAVTLFGKGLDVVTGSLDKIEQMAIESAKLNTQMQQLGKDGTAQLMSMRQATDDLIQSDQLMRAKFALTRNGLKLTEDQFNSVLKAAVHFSRAGGEEVGTVLDRLAKGITGGTVSALNDFGFALDETGTISDRQKRILDSLSGAYKDVTVSAKGAAEEAKRSANATKANMAMFTDDRIKAVAKGWRNLKDGAKELGLMLVTFKSHAGRHVEILNRLRKNAEDVENEMISLRTQYTLTALALEKTRKGTLEYSILLEKQRKNVAALQKKEMERHNIRVAALKKELELESKKKNSVKELIPWAATATKTTAKQRDALEKMLPWARKINEVEDNSADIQKRLAAERKLHSEVIKNQTKNVKDLTDAYGDLGPKAIKAFGAMLGKGMNAAATGIAKVNKLIDDGRKKLKAKEAAARKAASELRSLRGPYEQELKLINARIALMKKEGDEVPAYLIAKRGLLEGMVKMQLRELKAIELQQKAHDANRDAEKKEDDAAQIIHDKKIARLKKLAKELGDEHKKKIARDKEWEQKLGEAAQREVEYQQNLIKEKMVRDELNAAGKIGLDITKAKKELQEAMLGGNQGEIQRIKENISALNAQKMAVSESMAVFKAMSTNIVKGLTMENSELKKLGKTRTQYIMETLAATLKAKGIEYAIKSLGSFAEAAAASFFNPPAAAALAKAGALYAAAAAAAGIAGAAIGSGGGGGTAATNTSPSAQASAGSTTGTTQSSGNTYHVHIEKSTIFGNTDEAGRQIKAVLADIESRGVG